MRLALIAVALAAGLSACNDTTTASRAPTQAPGVPIALESISGAPDGVRGSFTSALSNEANARRLDIVDPATNPRYRVRGYLAAQPTEDGQTSLAFVWDVFDSQKKRAQRVQGATVARGNGGWNSVDQTTMTKAASESMDQIAQFLVGQDQVAAASTSAPSAVEAARTANAAQPSLALRR